MDTTDRGWIAVAQEIPLAAATNEATECMPDLGVGTQLNIDDVCVGVVVQDSGDRILINSDVFTGWAWKDEIREAMRSAT